MKSRKRRLVPALVGIFAAMSIALAACGGDDSSDSGDGDGEIFIGIAAAKSGVLALYDGEWGNAFEIAVDEINDDGGIDGQQVTTQWLDTESDPATGQVVANRLLDDGAELLVVSGDFDLGSPQAIAAERRGVVSMSFGAADPKFADGTTIGPLSFTFGSGGDSFGTVGAEYAFNEKGYQNAYVLTDRSLELFRTVDEYFTARFEELGGNIVGSDNFSGSENTDISTQVTRMRSDLGDADFIYLSSYTPPGAQALRQIRAAGIDVPVVVSDVSMYGPSLTEITGPLENYVANGYACVVDCSGQDNPSAEQFVEQWTGTEGGPPATAAHPLLAYDLAYYIKAAIEQAGTTDGEELAGAMETMEPVDLATGSVQMTESCHAPANRQLTFMEYQGKDATFIGDIQPEQIPDIGDLPCAGE